MEADFSCRLIVIVMGLDVSYISHCMASGTPIIDDGIRTGYCENQYLPEFCSKPMVQIRIGPKDLEGPQVIGYFHHKVISKGFISKE